MPIPSAPSRPVASVAPRASKEALLARAAYYGLSLRQQGYAPDEAAMLVIRRYPAARPFLERLTRPPVRDPLAGLSHEEVE